MTSKTVSQDTSLNEYHQYASALVDSSVCKYFQLTCSLFQLYINQINKIIECPFC